MKKLAKPPTKRKPKIEEEAQNSHEESIQVTQESAAVATKNGVNASNEVDPYELAIPSDILLIPGAVHSNPLAKQQKNPDLDEILGVQKIRDKLKGTNKSLCAVPILQEQ